MSEPFLEKVYGRKLAHAYVALALAKDVANHYVNEQRAHTALSPLLTILDITAELLEEILQNTPSEEFLPRSLPMPSSDMVM